MQLFLFYKGPIRRVTGCGHIFLLNLCSFSVIIIINAESFEMGAEKMQTFSLDWMQEAEKLLQQLPGIFAVRFLAGNDHSTLEAIHILADTARNAKQVVRDVQAALSAAYALDIDHRIVSVAQLPVNPVKKEGLSESVPLRKAA